MNIIPQGLALLVVLSAGFAPGARASLLQLEFGGTLRRAETVQATAAVEGQLQTAFDGRSVRVRLDIETSTADSDPAAGHAEFRGAIRSAALSISGAALPMVLQGGQPYCADAPLLDCSIRMADDDPLGLNLQLDQVLMRSPSFDALGGPGLGGLLPVMSVFFARGQAGNLPSLLQGTDISQALDVLHAQLDGWRINLLGVGACSQDCYFASWAIDDLVFGPATVAAVPAPGTPVLAAAGLALMGWRGLRRRQRLQRLQTLQRLQRLPARPAPAAPAPAGR